MSRVLVIVVTYNGMPWLERCLGSVDTDLFVWDNDSTDGSADFVAKHFPQAHLVRSAENVGFAKANNMGFQYALEHGYDYVYLLNQDAWLEPATADAPGTLETLLAASSEHPEFAVLSPLQMTNGFFELDLQFSRICGFGGRHALPNRPGAGEGTYSRISAHPRADKREGPVASADEALRVGRDLSEAKGIRGYVPSPEPVRRIMAAHWLVPVKAIKEIGLFNEELFPLYGQDDDWCNRARYKGWKIGVVKEARAVHDRAQRQESKDRLIDRNYRSASLVRLADPNRPLWASYLYVCLYTVVKFIKYRSVKVFVAFRQICSQLPAVRSARP